MAEGFTDYRYDVFLSFRGEDTPDGFTRNLYHALSRRRIEAYFDPSAGDEISHSLLKAIEESRIYIIVFSENYASSTRCLDELVNILECRERNNQLVVPIFYKVNPPDVRRQRNSYAEAMAAHEKRLGKEKVIRWRSALKLAAGLSGYHYTTGERSEYEYIETIVDEVSTRLLPHKPWRMTSNPDLEHAREKSTTTKEILSVESDEPMEVTDESKQNELPQYLRCLRVEGYGFQSLPDYLVEEASYVFDLYAIDCPSLKDLGRGNFTSLTTLYILNCRNLDALLSSENFPCLEHLSVGSSCDSLEDFILNHFPKLKTLCIWNCPKLESLSIFEKFGHGDLPLESLEIRDCPGLVFFQTEGSPTTKLVSLTLSNCTALRSLPNGMALKSLLTMFIDRCPELDSLPEGGLPASLSLLSISFCDKLIPKKEWELNRLHSLTCFEIEIAGVGMKSFPEKDLLPTSLNSLRISNLSSLTDLDYRGIQQLTALQSLDINCCDKLSSFPEELPSSLVSLNVQDSPKLTQNLKFKVGANWRRIARVPNIRIDGDFITSKKFSRPM